MFPVWLVQLFWTRRTDQTQDYAGNLSTGTAMFSPLFMIQHTACLPFHHAFYAHRSWSSFDNLQPICPCFEGISGKTAGLPGCPAKLSVVQVGGWGFGDTGGSRSKTTVFPALFPFLPLMHLICNHRMGSVLLQWAIIWQLLFWVFMQPPVDREGNKSFAYRANILSSPAVHPNENLPDSLEWFHAS